MKVLLKSLAITVVIMQLTILNAFAYEKFYNWNDIEKYTYDKMQNRESNISFTYIGPKDNFKANMEQALKNTYSKDDYLERSWLEIKPEISYGNNGVDTILNIKYLSSKNEENYVDNELQHVTASLINSTMSDFEKVSKINQYIIDRYEYDYSLKSVSAYSALTTSKTVCQGYAMTAYKMFNYAQIESRIVVGRARGISHSWNCVKINGSWYHIDITNNDSTVKNKYFLLGDNSLIQNGYVWNKAEYPICINDYSK